MTDYHNDIADIKRETRLSEERKDAIVFVLSLAGALGTIVGGLLILS